MSAALVFAVMLATYLVAHNIADHVLGQNDHQAAHKAERSRRGIAALLGHVFQYHIVMLIMTLITVVVLDVPITFTGLVLSMLFSAVTHAFLDLRWPVRWILQKTGSPKFAEMTTPVNGMYQGDQSLHHGALWISALIIACL